MEAEAQRLQDALPNLAVYLGSEWLVKQPQLPHVVVIPGNAEYGPPEKGGDTLAAVQLQETYVCKAALFEEAVLLAEACYAALAPGRRASLQLSSELWGEYVVRTAALTVTYPATLSRTDVTRVQVHAFTQHTAFINPNIQEVPDGPNEETGRRDPTGVTDFRDRPG